MRLNWRGKAFRYWRDEPGIDVDTNKVYDLPELIDIAERANPETQDRLGARAAGSLRGRSEPERLFPVPRCFRRRRLRARVSSFPDAEARPRSHGCDDHGWRHADDRGSSGRRNPRREMVAVRFRGTQGDGDHGQGKPDDGECRIQCRPSTDCFHSHAAILRIEYRAAKSRGC